MLDGFGEVGASANASNQTDMREVTAAEETFTGFVFKIQS